MRLAPFADFIKDVLLNSSRAGWVRTNGRVRSKARQNNRRKSRAVSFAGSAELLESKALLAGPQLVSVSPNTGGALANGQVRTEAPRELVFTFSPGATIDGTTVSSGITVTRSGADGTLGTGDDIAIPVGFSGVGPQTNEVTVRFADSLVNDLYRVEVNGSLTNTQGEAFNNGVAQRIDFRVDFGGQVVSVVPQPVFRTPKLTIADASRITDGDRFTIDAGSGKLTFQFHDVTGLGVVPAGVIGVNYTPGASAATLATAAANAINASTLGSPATSALRRLTVVQNGATLDLQSPAFTPKLGIQSTQIGFLTAADGALSQAQNTIVVHFNQTPLDPTAAQTPAFYQVQDSATGALRLPETVSYDSVGNNAVLHFGTALPAGTFKLKVGAPNLPNENFSQAFDLGTLALNTNAPTVVGFIGDKGTLSNDRSDLDVYTFRTGANGTSGSATAFDRDPAFINGMRLRLFDVNGNQLAATETNNASVTTISFTGLTPNTQYYLGVTARGNNSYNPVTGTGLQNGNGTGSYKLQVVINQSQSFNNNTSSFGTATNLGVVAGGKLNLEGTISPPGTLAFPPAPGGNDEPGHREIPIAGETNDTDYGGQTPTVPNAIPTIFYNFKSIYGQDPQGNDLFNAITDAQKQRAREIFEIYSRYWGVEFVETDNTGLIIVTGDPRAVSPTVPPTAVGGITDGTLVVMNAAFDFGTSPYGGSWFNIAFHEIGHALGLSHSYDAPGVMGQDFDDTTSTTGAPNVEPVYPGDIPIVAGRRLLPTDGTDVNIYQFDLTQAGTLSANAVAQLMIDANLTSAPSLLDPVLSLYNETYKTASVTTDFGTNGAVRITFRAKQTGVDGNQIQLVVTKSALGDGVAPQVTVNGTSINIVLNTTAGSETTAGGLLQAIQNSSAASNLIEGSLDSGLATTNVAAPNTTYSPLRLAGGATTRTLISRNDDFYGRDSKIEIAVPAGRYYLAISSTGNTDYDPAIPDSGYGGRTDGNYSLEIDFTPTPATAQTLTDIRGIPLDGDLDYRAGGTFNFWFKTGTTIFVDKNNVNDVAPNGTLSHPYGLISEAIANAAPGTIVRILGNTGSDGLASTLGDNKPYLIGFDAQGAAAEDGAEFIVPKGVTVMIDEGAIIKLRGAIIDVGKTVTNIDRDGGALQVLGTPGNQVQFTSLANDAIGGRSDPNDFVGPEAGNWGGIVYRQNSDFEGLNGRKDGQDWELRGVFLNSVNQATFSFGGGQVNDDSVLQVFSPIHVENRNVRYNRFSRPNIWFNTITTSADAAISADPNSFANSDDRHGLFVRGNKLSQNSLNGLFIRVRTEFGVPVDTLQIPARIDDIDIVYVLPENLFIDGGAGGPYLPNPSDPLHTNWQARLAGSLVLDPGVILKLSGSRIQAQVGGSQLLAEGTQALPVIFTSLRDDTYGAGGAFDTGSDGAAPVNRGDWAGLYFAANSTGSLDHAVVQYAGGFASIAGDLDRFNPVEVQQADVRVANSLFRLNADGQATGTRDGLLTNRSSTIFVRGSQPVIVNNTFINNQGNVISINANALNSEFVDDWGRNTGAIDAKTNLIGNTGPLVSGNLLSSNSTNGLEVRGERITTETIWDDADIVHVLRDEVIEDINRHTFGGVRLQSSSDSSLVVKLSGPSAGFTVTGVPLDIIDRIGGTLQVIGNPQFPVILTSLNDDSVGAGFRPDRLPQNDTDNDGNLTPPTAGEWRSLRLDKYSNDRNVAVALEAESTLNPAEVNATPATAQFLGSLAPAVASDSPTEKKGGNDYQPYGYEIHGALVNPSDVDTYSFSANRGTEIWLDISRTSVSLDTVVELVDANGNVLAVSNDSQFNDQSGSAAPRGLTKNATYGGDFYTLNPRDSGMRLVLPGAAAVNTYFVRVRSNGGLTSGSYNLQLRIRQVYEAPGSTIRYADVRFATNGIEVLGMPGRSPLSGEASENPNANGFANPTRLGNLMATDMNTLSVSGSLANQSQVDWYQFRLQFDLIQAIGGVNGAGKTLSTIFDIDYADGLVRPDAIISVFDSNGNLVLVARDSNIADDQPGPTLGNGLTDMLRGTVGKLDPYIGAVQLSAGTPGTQGFDYFVAISSNAQLPAALNGTFTGPGANGLVRLEPVNSVKRIVEDHIGFTGHMTGNPAILFPPGFNHLDPVTGPILPVETIAELQTSVRPFELRDVTLYGLAGDNLATFNPSNGDDLYNVGVTVAGFQGSIKMRSDGVLFGYRGVPGGANQVGALVRIDPATGATTQLGTDAIPDFDPNTAPPDPNQLTSDTVNSFAFMGNSSGYRLFIAPQAGQRSRLYEANPANGAASTGVIGTITGNGVTGTTNGMAAIGNTLFGVSSGGQFYRISTATGAATLIKDFGTPFSGLTEGPKNLNNGALANVLFATTQAGRIVAFDTAGNLLSVFANNATQATIGGLQAITFSPLDFNLWHPTFQRANDQGHGINQTFDKSREYLNISPQTIGGRRSTEDSGGASFYFGMENWVAVPTSRYLTYGANAQYGIQATQTHTDLTSNFATTGIGGNYNLPGGAHGSLVTGSFSLLGYQYADKPTLYFNYFLATEGANSTISMRDSARVMVSSDGGTSWRQLATNNSDLSAPGTSNAELPAFASASSGITAQSNQRVQELFDNTGGWRQARVDLGDFAGQANLILRFDFSTSGSSMSTAPVAPDIFGVGANDVRRALSNTAEGFYIDDIIIGLAERGEMVTNAPSNQSFFAVPVVNDPAAGTQSLSGAYQLEIRRGQEYGEVVTRSLPDTVIRTQFDTNDRLAAGIRIRALAGSQFSDGQTFIISDGVNETTYEFDSNSSVTGTNRRIAFTAATSAADMAVAIRNAINSAKTAGVSTVTAELSDTNLTAANNSGTLFVELINATSVTPPVSPPEVTVSLPTTFVVEGGGVIQGTVSRTGSTTAAQVVTLAVINPVTNGSANDVAVPATVTIPAGAASINFNITIANNSSFSGTRTVVIRPTATGMASIIAPLDVRDDETGTLTLTVTGPVTEGNTLTATVSRGASLAFATTVNLRSLDDSEISVPASVTIPAGASSVTFTVTGVQDGVDDTDIVAGVTASASAYASSIRSITVVDSNVTAPSTIQVGPTVNASKRANDQSEGAIVIDRTNANRLFMASNHFGGSGIAAAFSVDAGATWTTRIIADGGDGFPDACCDPTMASDTHGNLFLAYLDDTADTNVILISTDFGQSFTQLARLPAVAGAGVDQPTIVAGSNAVWLTWRSSDAVAIVASGAAVTGLGAANVGAFSAAQTAAGSGNGNFGDIAIGPTGQVVVTYQTPSGGQGPAEIRVNLDPDGLGPMGFNGFVLATTTNVGGFDFVPAQSNRSVDSEAGLAFDFQTGRLYLMYTEETAPENNDLDILIRHSDDNGTTWSTPRRVNDDAGANTQMMPRIAVDNAVGSPTRGFVAISWYDARNDLGLGGTGDTNGIANDDVQFYTSYSSNQGITFAPNARVSAGTSNSDATNNPNDFGDYTGLDFWNGVWYPLWSDNSNGLAGNPDVPNLDQATARVTLGASVPQPTLSVNVSATTLVEGGATSSATVTRSGSTVGDLVVNLNSSIPGLATVPGTVTILDGQASATFTVTPQISPLAVTREAVFISVAAAGFDGQRDVVDVTDTQVRALTVNIAGTVAEGSAINGTVTRNTPNGSALTVTVFVTDVSEASVTPVTVTIPAGSNSATFSLTGSQDFLNDGTKPLTVVAVAAGHDSGRANVSVTNTAASFVSSYNRRGDSNTVRDQGQIQIYANTVSNAQQFGIVIDEGSRDAGTNLPHPGAVLNGSTLNSTRLLPGANVSNNIINNFGQGGIRFEGSGLANPVGSVPFGRIVNNTIFGQVVAQGVGISVANNAGPTIMNNIIANTVTGISVDGPSAPTTVIDANLFHRNTVNIVGVSSTNTIALTPASALFVNAAQGNFYLAQGSQAIDSSRNSLSERSAISSVKSPFAIPVSPIIAPSADRFGQLRVDDAAVPNAIGLGANIFIDRGAIERADFSKPKARLITPLDNGEGVDGNPSLDTVFLTSPAPLTQFVLQLTDLGVGIDHSTVISSSFIVRQDGRLLVDGVDYIFVYNRNTRQVFFQSVSVFAPQSTYTITVPANTVADLAGNTLQANQVNGSTVFTIVGNAPPSLTQVATLPGLKNVDKVISYADLLAASDLRVVTGHSALFRIESVLMGTLVIRKSGQPTAVPVVPGVTLVEPGDTLTFTPPNGRTGVTGAFTVVGYDPQNALIAPALAVSNPPVTVSIDLVDVAPTMTSVDPNLLGNATEDTPFNIPHATLLAASNAVDANNDQIRFRVTEILSGTLQVVFGANSPVAVTPGITVFGPGDRLIWTPPLNQNNELNGGNALNAFRIQANDGTNDSSPPVTVSINVLPVPDAPILTKVTKLSLGGLNSPFKIPFATLLAASNAQNVDNHPVEFQIASIPTGATLGIRKAATPGVTTPAVAGVTVFSAGDVLIYTPPTGVSGDPVAAFEVVAYDSFNAANHAAIVPTVVTSSPNVVVPVQVLNQVAPHLTTIATLVRPRFVASTITYQQLVDASDLAFQPGNTVAFRIDNIDQGTLLINGSAATVGTLVKAGDTLTWTLNNATGLQNAFDVTAVDLNNTLTSLDPVQVNVNLVNIAPTLTTISTLAIAEEQTAFGITYAKLLSSSNAADANNDAIQFRIESISTNGTLQITHNGVTTNAVVGTLVVAGDALTWTPAVGITGDAVAAFTVKAFDGELASANPVQVNIRVRPWGSEFSLSGLWSVNGRLARINQNGANLTFVNENGVGSTGQFIARDQVSATGYGLTAKIDLTAADQGRLIFSNGVIWLRISLGGQWATSGKLASIVQSNDVQLSFVNGNGQTSGGAILTSSTLIATSFPNAQATFGDGKINFNNGEVWTKLDLSPLYTSSIDGKSVQVIQNGTTTLGFVDQVGNTTSGRWTSTTALIDNGRNRTGTVNNGRIVWSDGETWNKALTILGTQTGQPTSKTVSITATPTAITAVDINGGTSNIRLLALNTLRGESGAFMGMIGQRRDGKIFWSNGVVWENFDYNALNALFADLQSYPRP